MLSEGSCTVPISWGKVGLPVQLHKTAYIYIYHCTLCTKDYFKHYKCVTFLDPFCCDLNIFFLSVPPLLTKNALTVSVMNASEGCQSASCGHVIFPGFPPVSFVWNVSTV